MRKSVLSPNVFTVLSAVLLTIIIGVIDYITGYELNFFVFYFISIAYVAWKSGIYATYGIVQLCIVTWLIADIFSEHEYSSVLFLLWNTFIRFSAFFFIAHIVQKIKKYFLQEKAVSGELRKALAQIKTLQGLIPICANCKKVRVGDAGYWEQVEDYISRNSELKFTHGICEACAEKLYPELMGKRDSVPN